MKKVIALAIVVLLSSIPALAQYQHMEIQNPDRWWEDSPVNITETVYSIKEKGSYSEVNAYISFQASRPGEFDADAQLELVANFELPAEYEISNLWLWVFDDIVEARMYDKWTAQRIYEGIVNRRKDPALIVKNGPTSYELRIYPFKRDEIRTIRLTYLIPNQKSPGGTKITLPKQIHNLANLGPEEIGLIYWSESAPELRVNINPDKQFEQSIDDGETYWQASVEYQTNNDLTISSMVENVAVEVQTFSDGEDKFYDLSIFPTELVNDDSQNDVAILIDYFDSNTSLDRGELIDALKLGIKNSLSDDDRFNIFFSGFQIDPLSDTWINADDSSIDSVFALITDTRILDYDNIAQLCKSAIDFIIDTNSKAKIMLIGSTQALHDFQIANTRLEAIIDYRADLKTQIFVTDIQDRNFESTWRNGYGYSGNEYFYQSLTRETAGELVNWNDVSSPDLRIEMGLSSINANITNFDLYMTATDGFTFNRFDVSGNFRQSLQGNFSQIGRFVGSFPFRIEVSGLVNNEVFVRQINVDEANVKSADSTLKRIWSANAIKDLENEFPTNEVVRNIIDLSLDNRILTEYTAFLALEPSDTVEVCTSCDDERNLVSNEDEFVPDGFEIDTLAAYPNPFNPSVNINVNVAEVWNSDNSSIEIFNMLGQLVARLNTAAHNGSKKFTVSWDVNQSGGGLATGVYIVRMRTPRSITSMKITYLK